MDFRILDLMLDSFAIGVVIATLTLCAGLIFDVAGMAQTFDDLGLIALAVVWLHLSVFIAPFATLILLARMSE